MEIQGRIHTTTDIQSSSHTQQNETQNNQNQLTPEEQEKVAHLKQRDQEVRQHEQAHVNAGAGLTSSPNFEYETGPDGRQYVVDGSVDIDTSKDVDPEKTLKKAKQIQAAALAPGNPSNEDRAVASKARQMEQEAQREIQDAKQKENRIYNQSGTDDKLPTIQSTISLIA